MNRLTDEQLAAMAGFTEGPWVANGRYIGTAKHMSAVGECRDVNGNWCDDVKASANARLIAAAPAMYAELLERRAMDSVVREALEKANRSFLAINADEDGEIYINESCFASDRIEATLAALAHYREKTDAAE